MIFFSNNIVEHYIGFNPIRNTKEAYYWIYDDTVRLRVRKKKTDERETSVARCASRYGTTPLKSVAVLSLFSPSFSPSRSP